MKLQPWKPVGGCYGKVHYCLTGVNKTLCGIKTPIVDLPSNGWFTVDAEVNCKNCLKKAVL